jgi:hypothetical protein
VPCSLAPHGCIVFLERTAKALPQFLLDDAKRKKNCTRKITTQDGGLTHPGEQGRKLN